MRIVSIVHTSLPQTRAGSEITMHEMLKALRSRGHDVVCYSLEDRTGAHLIDGVSYICGAPCHELIKAENPDVVISHHKSVKMALEVARSKGAKFVQSIHNNNGMTVVDVLLPTDLFVVNTRWLRDLLCLDGVVVHPPVYAEKHMTERGRKVTLVNLIPEKGSITFYQLAYLLPNVDFLGVKGAYGKQDIRRARNIEFVDTTTDMRRDVWNKTKILLMPSSYESYGMVGVEAMASGVPVIANPTDGLKESLGSAGIFIDRRDIRKWREKLVELLADDSKESEASLQRSNSINPVHELSEFCLRIESL